jgi:hypothetical protein
MLNLVNWYRHKYLSIPSSTCSFIPPPIHSLSISISLPLSVSVYPPLSKYIYPSGYLSLYPFSMSFSLSFPLSALISFLLSGFLSPSIPPFILPTICLPFRLSITPLIYSSIRLSRPVYIPSACPSPLTILLSICLASTLCGKKSAAAVVEMSLLSLKMKLSDN